jgi:hypothetical protein
LALLAGAASGCIPGYGLYPPPSPGAPETVTVKVREFSIDAWPAIVRKGRVVFEVTNLGVLEHAVALVGPGLSEPLTEEVGPGEHQTVSAVLALGRYRLFCPDSDHARRGMSADLVVEETTSWFRR